MTGERPDEVNPFFAHETPRESQRMMIADGIESLKNGGFLLAAAPTGIGKTAAALASSLTIANSTGVSSEIPKIMFLTGRQSQHRIVVDTIREINKSLPVGLSKVRLVDIIGRRSMCKNVDSKGRCDCEKRVTESERRFLRSGLEEFIHSGPMHVDQILKKVENRDICAWATAREAARSTNVIVCDYNHIFVEGVRDSSLPVMGLELKNTIIIVDEAHNLPDRIRKGLERTVDSQVFKWALENIVEYKENLEKTETELDIPESNKLREVKSLENQIKSIMEDSGIANWFEEKKYENDRTKGEDIRVDTREFLEIISNAIGEVLDSGTQEEMPRIRMMINRLMNVEIDEEDSDDEKNDCTRLAEFLDVCIRYQNNPALALVFSKKDINQDPRITSHLLDPSVVGESIFEQCLGSILMSGTLFPPEMYLDILGIPMSRSNCIEYSSGFPPENRPVLIARDVTTKFAEREQCMESILEHIGSVINHTKGNVAIFAPSYSMLNRIHDHFEGSWGHGKTILKEEQGMRKKELLRIVDRLRELKDMRGAALFGVLSGKLSEGVDYPDNSLNSVVCVGLPLPPPSAKQDALVEYYSKKFDRSRAWKYASLQPAVNSVLQALGRPIRKKEDRAIVVLLEKRLLNRRESDCLPEMQKLQTSSSERTAERVKAFFEIS